MPVVTGLLAAHVAFLLHGVSWTVTLLQVVLHTNRPSADLQRQTHNTVRMQSQKKLGENYDVRN